MKKIINTPNAPAPIGPYNQAIIVNGTLYISGQVAINPATGDMMQNSIEEETHRVMQNLKAILDDAGMTFNNVVKTCIFLSDMNSFTKVNEIYGSYLGEIAPARETVQVSKLPKNANVEISMIAVQ
ncbi:MAG TPA: RidA family protein [Bacteroidia bacterium]|nr:RidA family protein [Bacteroidia bacterium]HNU32678.1 RidA family protein [Bacteroidia bacterium]